MRLGAKKLEIIKANWRKLVAGFAGFLVLVVALDLCFAPPLYKADNLSPLVIDRHGNWVHSFINDDGMWRFQAELEEIDPVFIERLLLIEDKRFYEHGGVDLVAVIRAGKSALGAGRIVSGASTITMQTARLLEPRPRNIGSKIIEMIRAVQIERRLSKEEILSLYLTLAPYGSNIQGVRAASLVWFDKEPALLTNAEQALLIALPQAPESRRPDRKPIIAKSARDKILDKLVQHNALQLMHRDEAQLVSLPSHKHKLSQNAWHFAHSVSRQKELSKQDKHATKGVVQSTLDIHLQKSAEALVTQYSADWRDDASAAVMIVHNQTREVRALVGSSSRHVAGGWIDLTNAVRSPGSTLKPFIYGLAFEDGILNANSVINDMPQSFGGYSPENFDRTFRGEVRIREALQHSLNIPAVTALEGVGSERFSAIMTMAGAHLKTAQRAEKKSGLALALGGAGIRMRELASLYAGLAQDGKILPLHYIKTDKPLQQDGYQFVSGQTAKKITDILYGVPSLAGRAPAKLMQDAPKVAFKTGTSYGFRDAWAAGFNENYTVLVWVGRADGAPRPGATGRKVAAPLLFSLFDMVKREAQEESLTDKDFQIDDMYADDENILAYQDYGNGARPIQGVRTIAPPQIVFPANGVEIFIGPKTAKRGIALSGRGGAGRAQWYVEGQPIEVDPLGERPLWFPKRAGFYTIALIDERGEKSTVQVRVRMQV